LTEDWQNGGFAVYVHWPFCTAKCPYCDFNSHVSRSIDQKKWLSAYLREIDRYAAEAPGRTLTSIFFGGGTPSLMEPNVVAAIIERIRGHWSVSNSLEITLEANPGSVEAGRFRAYSEGGVNRISMGIQALNDRDLARLGRIHSAAEARAAFDIARQAFDRVSFDLIYARQEQSVGEWRRELEEALAMAIDHLSLYQLTIEEGTAFGDRYRAGKLRGLPEEDISAEMFHVTQDLCAAAGMDAYEISNHARPDAQSRHNLVYWNYGDYVGIGPGAHGRLTLSGQKFATEAVRQPGAWLKAAEAGATETVRDALNKDDMASEMLLMGLRLRDGIDPARYQLLKGKPLNSQKLSYLGELGMVELGGYGIRATSKGRVLLNAVIAELLED
jgi:putative oxygen-independent coproporphyrinogen III oxidase